MDKTAKELINALSSGPVRQYLSDHEHDDVRQAVLKHKELFGIPAGQLLDQIATRKKAKDKLPLYYNNPAVIYPAPQKFEQSSSETTARFKASVAETIAKVHGRGADLTGGFGVDSYFLSKSVNRLDCVEPDSALLEIARHNHRLLGADNIDYYPGTAEDFIRATRESFDFVYVDPSRRAGGGKKVNALEDSVPDITSMAPQIFSKSAFLLVKASPLLDIQAGISKIPFVRQVKVVSVSNECKEVLFLCEKDFSGVPSVEAVDIQDDDLSQTFEFTFPEERARDVKYSDPKTYLYEPNASILKAGAFKSVASQFGVEKLHASTHLYTSDDLVDKFPGRTFLIEAFVRPRPAELRIFFAEGKANVTTRNYPLTPEALKKKTALKDGGQKFLIGFSGRNKKFLVVARRV